MSDSGLYINRQAGKQNNLNSPTSRQDDNAQSAAENVGNFLQRVGVGKSTQQPIVYQSPTTTQASMSYQGPELGGRFDRYA